ncbi:MULTISPECIES: TrmH family RNA methyltransferase [Comamonas]|uniref:RNA methyltransferase n=1 Tax=Comamonas terrigena TaxID=32013 RepID=A0A2A7UU82_COMTR|nr:RNA methyltransferase [Comamonas terrigena]MBD9530039.1 RNA methyltransferase [Comamonas sp. CMM01]PEH88818.1 RNA methyltransferase [Comamonas terrigena]SUY72529.1 23S rRNA (guanosine-2'-O-)-methyltransferase RlmB [Comamonas terrigena]
MMQHTMIQSRDNAFVKELRRLSQESTAYRKQGQVWLEGDHLCRAALARGLRPKVAVFAESVWPQVPAEWVQAAGKAVVLADSLFAEISSLESPARMGYVMEWDVGAQVQPGVAAVVLDRVQDAGNVGSILRSAAAFGFGQIVALKGTAALWSQKVLRAGMGAHFGLHLVEAASIAEVQALQLPLVVTSSHQGTLIHEAALPWPCAWAMGHEGQGVGDALMEMAEHRISIAQPGGEESLNVAAAAAICLHASSVSMLRALG